jgi:hypothetical protein
MDSSVRTAYWWSDGCSKQGVMSTLLIPHDDLRLGDPHLRRGLHEVSDQIPRLSMLVASADAASHRRYRLLSINVNCRSQLTFIAIAELNASI